MTRAELIGIMAAILHQPGHDYNEGDALDLAIYLADEAERRCQKEPPQMQEFDLVKGGEG